MARKRIIGLDLDITLLHLDLMVEEMGYQIFGNAGRLYDPSQYHFGFGPTRYEEIFRRMIRQGRLAKMPLNPGTAEILWAWVRAGHELPYITARQMQDADEHAELSSSIQEQTLENLRLHGLPFPDESNVFFVAKPRAKGLLCQQLGASILVDDHPIAVQSAHGLPLTGEPGEAIVAYLMHHDHNERSTWENRVRSLKEVEQHARLLG